MHRRIRPSLGSAHALALVALFAALGGGGAFAIGAGGGKTQVKACYVKRGSAAEGTRTGELRLLLRARRCGSGERRIVLAVTGPQGPAGSTGPTGAPGATGQQGARGPSAFEPIPSGATVRGIGGGDLKDGATGTHSQYVWLPAPAPVALDNAHIRLATADPTDCPGTPQAPTAAPGFVCVYSIISSSATLSSASLSGSQTGEAAKLGFGVFWTTTVATHFVVFSWAYTAP